MKRFHSRLLLPPLFLISWSATAITLDQLRSGDLLLLPLQCESCEMIEQETQSLYSHSAVLLKNPQGELVAAESSTHVTTHRLTTLLGFVQAGQLARVVRPLEYEQLFNSSPTHFAQFERDFFRVYRENFANLPFDPEFLWTNHNESGQEKLYCSEFITKLLNRFLKQKYGPHPMTFQRHRDYWEGYFHNRVPEGEEGNAPGDFLRSPLFRDLGDLSWN